MPTLDILVVTNPTNIDVIPPAQSRIEIIPATQTPIEVPSPGGYINSVHGTAGKITVDTTDPRNPIVDLDPDFDASLWNDRGNYNASSNLYPSTGGSGTGGAVLKGDIWTVSVSGTLGSTAVTPGYTVRALVNTPGQTEANWAIGQPGLGYAPENPANKDASGGYVGKTLQKVNLRNNADTFTSLLQNTNTAARTYTLQDRDGTLTDLTDIQLTVPVGFLTAFSPVDGTTYYFGILKSASGVTTDGLDGRALITPITGHVVGLNMIIGNSAVSTSENNTFVIANKTQSTTVTASSLVQINGQIAVNLTGFSLAVTAGDLIGIRWTTPVWATNPVNVTITGTMIFTRA